MTLSHELFSSFNSFPIHFQASFPGKFVFHNRLGICKLLKFRRPFADMLQFRIKPFCLQVRIEDPEIRSSITTCTCGPLPVAVIGRQFRIQKLVCKIRFTPSPVDQQMPGKKRSSDHVNTIMHKPGFIQLAHSWINSRVVEWPERLFPAGLHPGSGSGPAIQENWMFYTFQ